MAQFTFAAEVRRFPGEGGWFHVVVPDEIAEQIQAASERRWPWVRVHCEGVGWDASLMPAGDGTRFVTIKQAVRGRLGADIGDDVTVEVHLRR